MCELMCMSNALWTKACRRQSVINLKQKARDRGLFYICFFEIYWSTSRLVYRSFLRLRRFASHLTLNG